MRKSGVFVLGIGLVIAGIGPLTAGDDDALNKAMKKTEGAWQVISRIVDGKKAPEDELKGHRLVLKDGKWTAYKGKEVASAGTYKIVALEKDHWKVDLPVVKGENAGKSLKNISKIEGDTLTVCIAPVDKERPTAFASKPGSGHVLTVYQRVKP